MESIRDWEEQVRIDLSEDPEVSHGPFSAKPDPGALNVFRSSLESFLASIERSKSGQTIPVIVLKDQLNSLREARHELYASLFQDENSLGVGQTDEKHLPKVLSELTRLGVNPVTIELLKQRQATEAYTKIREYTPDTVSVELDDRGEPMVTIIDYTVTVKPSEMIESKLEKYKPILDFYSSFQPNLTVACLSPSTGKQDIRQLGRAVKWEEPRISHDMMMLFRRSIEVVRELLVTVPLDQREDLQAYLNSQMQSTERTQFDASMPFSLSVNEFLETIEKREGFRWHLRSLSEEERNLFFSSMIHESKGEAGKEDFEKRLKEFWPTASILTKHEYEGVLRKEKEEIMEEASNYNSDSPPVPPTKTVIDSALRKHDEAAKDRFEIITESRLVHHIPFHFRVGRDSEERKSALRKMANLSLSEKSLRELKEEMEIEDEIALDIEEGVETRKRTDLELKEMLEERFAEMCGGLEVESEGHVKKNRYKAALAALDQVINPNSDVRMLKDLFSMGSLEDDQFREFISGGLKMARCQNTGEVKTSKVVKRPSQATRGDTIQPMGPVVEEDDKIFYDWLKTKDCHSVSLKKGEVIVVRPSNTFEAKNFMERAGVGKKSQRIKNAEPRQVKKPVSLELSDQVVRQQKSLEYLSHSCELADACARVGRMIPEEDEEIMLKARKENTKLFTEMATKKEEKSIPVTGSPGSSSDTSMSTGSPKAFPAPKSAPPELGTCKMSIETLGEAPIRGKSSTASIPDVWRGVCHFGRTHQLFYENLSFVSQMASAGYRIVGSTNPGQFLITFPSESIMKGQSTVPYLVMTIVLPGDIYLNPSDRHESTFKLKCGGEIRLTKGRRPNRDQLTGHVSAYPRFMIACEILEYYRSESDVGPLNPLDIVNAYQFVHCININTSSLMDNMRYMVEVCMGQLSYIDQFIEDKLMVPAKTEMHMFLYVRMRELLSNINQSMDTVRMKVPSLDSEGTVDITTLRIVDGSFESYLFSGHYRKPDHLLMELITLFFCTSKGLHGKHHNLVEIHKTPLSIQEELNKFCESEFVRHPVKYRMQYSPKVIRAATKAAELATNSSTDEVRMRFMKRENPGGHPASISTLSSTSSTLIEAYEEVGAPEDTPLDQIEDKIDPSKKADAINEVQAFEEKLPSMKGEVNKRKAWRKLKKKVSKILGTQSLSNPITDKLCLDPRAGMLLRRNLSNRQRVRQQLKGLLDDEWRREAMGGGACLPRGEFATRWRKRFQFFDSGVVFTEVLRYSEERLSRMKTTTVSGMAKSHVKNVGKMRVAIRPKGQRTQKDREIFVVDLLTKTALYLLEHMYKQMCGTITAEKISMPGDSKVIDMHNQTKAELTWCKRTMESFAKAREQLDALETELPENVFCLHHNIDMTKWAPKDNLQKFNWVVAMSNFFTLEEKLFYMGVLDIMWCKKIYIDDDVILESMKSTMAGDFNAEECLFYRMTEGYKSNMVEVKQTWLQGQLNYMSSFVHVGAMKLYEESMHKLFPKGNCMVNINVHSDDNETTLCCATNMGLEEVALRSWSTIEYFCKNVCIELSRKKSSISMQCKQFIAIYNIGGEQIHPWVKAAMTVVSGLPYLTISDDISSAWSKIAEAGSKGAPKKVLRLCHEVTRIHVLDVHGILNRKSGKNKFSEELSIDETLLPVMLGGCHIRDWASFIICGPKYIDKGNMMHCLKTLTGAKADIEPQIMVKVEHRSGETRSRHENTNSAKCLRGLRMFVLADTMCYDQADDEEDSSACKGMNFFRPAKFKNRRTGMKLPFNSISKEQLPLIASELKSKNPCLMLKKPMDQRDLRDYCICQYADPKFQDSLAGQSPNMLLLGLIQARHKPRFRLLQTGSANKEDLFERSLRLQEDDLEGKVLAGLPITFEEVCQLLNNRLAVTNPNLADCKMLWRRYVANDPEFKSVQFALENCTTTTSYRKLNLVPSKKPDFSKYSELVNNISDLVVYLMDSDYCKRNGFGLHSPRSAPRDWIELSKMFPRETACMRMRASRRPKEMENLIQVLKQIDREVVLEEMKEKVQEQEKLIRSQKLNSEEKQSMLDALRDRLENTVAKRTSWADIVELNDTWEEDEMEATIVHEGLPIPGWLKFKEDDKKYYRSAVENLPRDLLRMARTFKGRTSRVLFTPPTHTDDILEMSLQLRSSIESTGEYQLRMFLNANLTSSRTKQMLTDNPNSVQWHYKAADALSHLYEACRLLGATEYMTREILQTTEFCGKPIMDVQNRFPKLPTEYQHRIIVPMYIYRPAFARMMVESMGPYLKEWKVVQDEYGRGEFLCEVRGTGFNLTAQGMDNQIERLTISHTGSLPLGPLNMVMSDLSKDIRNAGIKTRKHRVNLSSVLQTEPVGGQHSPILLDVSRNRLAFWNERTNYLRIRGLTVEKVPGQMDRNIQIKGTTKTGNGIICKDGSVESTILHRLAKNPEYQLLSVPSMQIGGLDISSVMRMPGLGGLVKRRMDYINLQEMIKCTLKPGSYTNLYASMQAKILYKLINPNHSDSWLDEKEGTVTIFDRVIKYLRQANSVRQKLTYLEKRLSELEEQANEMGSSMSDMDSEDEASKIQKLVGDLEESELEEYLQDLREEREQEGFMEENFEAIITQMQECKKAIQECKMPQENFRCPNTLRVRSAKVMTRLQHFEDINTQMVLKRVERAEDLLSFCERLDQVGVIELAKSPVDVIRKIPNSAFAEVNKGRHAERLMGKSISPEEVFNNCCFNPLNPDEVQLTALVLGILIYCYTDRKALTKLSIKKYWASMTERSRQHALAMAEELTAVVDTRVFQVCPHITGKVRAVAQEPWETSFEDSLEKLAAISRSPRLRYRSHLKLLETLISTLRNDMKSAEKTKRGTIGVKQLSQGVSRATNRLNKRMASAMSKGLTVEQSMEYALVGSQMTGASNTETSEDDRQAGPSISTPVYANTVSIGRPKAPEPLKAKSTEESDSDDFDVDDLDSDEPLALGEDAFQGF
uniref:RNA-dependent RNA polymerase n=1 Tax=Painter's Point virus TaxID=3139878 RepID=A0AAN0LJ78_9VIRU